MTENRPTIAITMGDPVGIGPEIIMKAVTNPEIMEIARIFLIGQTRVFERVADSCNLKIQMQTVNEESKDWADSFDGLVNVLQIGGSTLPDLEFGKPSALAAEAAYLSIEKSVELALKERIDAVVTAPINKEEMRLRYSDFIGHTEAFEVLSNVSSALTMFQLDNMRIFFLTRHIALRDVFQYVKKDNVLNTLLRMKKYLKILGMGNPRMAVAGLNPHSSEGGIFGDDEQKEIEPAVRSAQRLGIDVVGPIPADSVFWNARQGFYDAVLSLYHDQGHTAAKTADFNRTVSVTLGLPFIRTSPDHGTAYDIASKFTANPTSMIESIKIASLYALRWKKGWNSIRSNYATAK